LLVADPLDGERLVNSQLRPRAGAIAIGRHDFSAARQEVFELCGTWGGGGMPLIPVTLGETVDERWSRILNESNIDGIERTDLLSDEEVRKYTDLHGPDTAQLIRVVVDLERKPTVQTASHCFGVAGIRRARRFERRDVGQLKSIRRQADRRCGTACS
jgi:hypothetical protein